MGYRIVSPIGAYNLLHLPRPMYSSIYHTVRYVSTIHSFFGHTIPIPGPLETGPQRQPEAIRIHLESKVLNLNRRVVSLCTL